LSEEPAAEVQEETPVQSEEIPSAEEPIVAEESPDAVSAEAVAEEAVTELSEEPAAETKADYVEEVAKDLSAKRQGRLSKLFGERKVLVRAVAGFFALSLVVGGAFSLAPSMKTSAPESRPMGGVIPPNGEIPGPGPAGTMPMPAGGSMPTPPTPVVTPVESPVFKVNSVRRPNRPTKSQPKPSEILPAVSVQTPSEPVSDSGASASPPIQNP
ncbi:MAG: hypothetical protein QG650_861, partial [Patescibacteria group bacterium]|nr:hypothetical protein [Patescibacteria group bacterium]